MKYFCVALALAMALGRPVRADNADIVVTTPGERTTKNKVQVGAVAGAGVLVGAIGLYFHLDSRSASADVSADTPTHLPWTPERRAAADRASSSATKATVAYGFGGALVVGALIWFFVTDPKDETTVIHPHSAPAATPTIEPAPGGGAMLGGMWRF
jgi:hypothetical protein